MTGKLIFKMELFKFFRDKSFLIAAGILSVFNIILTLLVLSAIGNVNSYYTSEASASIFVLILLIWLLLLFGNIVFAYMYPFHMISMDYKNSVMAMMIASGVNRKKLFFSKIGAIFICTIALMLLLTLVPFILCVIKIAQTGGWSDFMHDMQSIFYYTDFTLGTTVFNLLINYMNMLMIIATSCILMKGKNISFLVFIGLNMLNSLVIGILDLPTIAFNFGSTGSYVFSLFLSLLSIAVFGFISLKVLEKQNL